MRLGAIITPDAPLYDTGGLAGGEIMTAGTVFGFAVNGNPVNTIINNHKTKAGWAVGGGLEGHLVENWTGKVEYLCLDFGSIATPSTAAVGASVATAFNSRITNQIVRLGMNYKFD